MNSLQLENWQDKQVIVLGLAKSGIAVAKRLHNLGALVVVNDRKNRDECPEAKQLEELGIPVYYGEHPLSLLNEQVDVIVKNPGIPYHIPFLKKAISLEIPIVTEIEVASRMISTDMISITGSNGKTTTTTLVGEILSEAKISNLVAGNIGIALTDIIEQLGETKWLVAELSSFQLKGTQTFHPRIAALLNLYPAHLDFHQKIDDYLASKLKTFKNQKASDFAILNADSSVCQDIAGSLQAKILWFSRLQEVEQGVFVRDKKIVARLDEETETEIMPIQEISLKGEVNLENALAATAIALCAGASVKAIRQVLQQFGGVEHRLEYVTTINQVAYYNDSKATNSTAAMQAIKSFTEPTVWIAGGLDRGVNFQELVPVLKNRVKAAVFYGEAASILQERAKEASIKEIFQVEDLQQAVKVATKYAEAGDVVLLSPACASWDQYTSFEERGSIFKQAVHNLYK